MKRILLCILIIVSLATPVFAYEETIKNPTYHKTVFMDKCIGGHLFAVMITQAPENISTEMRQIFTRKMTDDSRIAIRCKPEKRD